MRYEKVKSKLVQDSDGFYTDYTWYKDENGYNVFVFGDSDLYLPEDGEYDWETESDEQAEEWFDSYNGFEDEDSLQYDEDDSENYTVETVTRYKETASPYDDPEDMYETAYIIRDKYGDIIYDTTNYDIVKEYIGECKKSLKESWTEYLDSDVYQRLANCKSRKSDIEKLVDAKRAYMKKQGKDKENFTKEDSLVSVLELLDSNGQFIDLTKDEYDELKEGKKSIAVKKIRKKSGYKLEESNGGQIIGTYTDPQKTNYMDIEYAESPNYDRRVEVIGGQTVPIKIYPYAGSKEYNPGHSFYYSLETVDGGFKNHMEPIYYLKDYINDGSVKIFDDFEVLDGYPHIIRKDLIDKYPFVQKRLNKNLEEDTVKQGNYWVNKGKEGTHGKFKTKKEAEAQRKAMFARGFKESKNLKEMNDRELEDAEQKMWQETRERTGKKDVWFKDVDKKTYNTLFAIRMINSVLAYHWAEGETAEELLDKELNRYKSYLQEYVDKLGREKVLELIENQMNDIDHIARNVSTDSEGLSYNGIVWKNK